MLVQKKRRLNDSPKKGNTRHLAPENNQPPLSPKKAPPSPLRTPKKSVLTNITNQRLPTPFITDMKNLVPTEDFPQSPMIKRSKPMTPRHNNTDHENFQEEQLNKVKTNLSKVFEQM